MFQVTYDPYNTSEEMPQMDGQEINDVPYPRFRRLRKICIDSNRTSVCDCCRFNVCDFFVNTKLLLPNLCMKHMISHFWGSRIMTS